MIPDGRRHPAPPPSGSALQPHPSGGLSAFGQRPPVATQFQALFTPLPGCFSAFPRGTAFAIGLGTYLGLEVGDPQLPTPNPRRGTQDTSPRILHPYAYGAFTLYGPPFQASSASGARNWGRSYNPTSPVGFPTRFGLPCPPFPRRYSGDRDCFLFLPLLRCFRSGRSRSLPGATGFYPVRKSHSGIPGSTPACGSPGLFAACHALPRRPSRAIHWVASLTLAPVQPHPHRSRSVLACKITLHAASAN